MRIFGIIALILLIGIQAQAQNRRGGGQHRQHRMTPEQRVDRQLQRLTQELQLDAAQQEKVRTALQNRVKAADELRAEATAERQTRMNKARAIRDDFNRAMSGILNAEQQAKFEQFQAKRREEMKNNMQQRRGKGKNGGKGRSGQGKAPDDDNEDLNDLEDF